LTAKTGGLRRKVIVDGEWRYTEIIAEDWTRDITAAWKLLEKMQRTGLNIEINIGLNGYVIGIWRPGEQLLFKQRYDTAPEAISRAYWSWQEAVQQEAQP
jgi:hypothetical protein